MSASGCRCVEVWVVCTYLMVVLHVFLVLYDYWDFPGRMCLALVHCLVYHALADVYIPQQINHAYTRDIAPLPYNHRVPWAILVVVVTVALDPQIKEFVDFFLGAPPDFEVSEFVMLFVKMGTLFW